MNVLVIAEHDNQHLNPTSLHTASAALKLADQFDVVVMGSECSAVSKAASEIAGVKQVFVADHAQYQHPTSESLADVLREVAKAYTHILAPATTFGKNLLPRLAALLDVGQVSDITEIVNADTFIRPIYAGNALATVKSHDAIKCISVRTTAFDLAASGTEAAPVSALEIGDVNQLSEFISLQASDSDRPDLMNARVVVAGGRGLGSAENFKLIEQLADQLNAAIGASRAAVDAGYVPNDYQVGQTGKVVAPDLYIAIGISGAVQHIAGIKDSKVIVAINKDPDAPIFEIADYGLVGDLFEIIPEFIQALK